MGAAAIRRLSWRVAIGSVAATIVAVGDLVGVIKGPEGKSAMDSPSELEGPTSGGAATHPATRLINNTCKL